MQKTYFITGIDTDAGKTWVTGAFARWLLDHGKDVTTIKIAQTGCREIADDIVKHREIMGTGLTGEDRSGLTCPYLFDIPASPHLSAELEGKRIDPAKIESHIAQLQQRHDYLLAEGAGGLYVPLTRGLFTIDWTARTGFPLVLVTSAKLGSINHTILSLEACRSKGIRVAAVAFNWYGDVRPEIESDSLEVIRGYVRDEFPDTAFIRVGNLTLENPDYGDWSVLL